MSAGETGGIDLTVETLQFILDEFETVAAEFDRATDGSGNVVWEDPILRNRKTKSLYPSGDTAGYTNQLSRNAYVVTVEETGATNSPIGTEFDFDVEAEVDVTIESVNNGFNEEISDSTDWETLKAIIKRCVLKNRKRPITDPSCRFDWRWITVTNETTLPESEENRDHYGYELTFEWNGFERNP